MHSPIGGSKAHVWGHCDGYVAMCSGLPEQEPSEDAKAGTAAHEVAELMIRSLKVGHPLDWRAFHGNRAVNGVEFTDEMFEAAEVYAEDVGRVMRSTGVFTPKVEKLIPVPSIHAAAFGYTDAWLFDHNNLTVYLWDFKFGHRYVSAFENPQSVFYFAGILDELREHLESQGIALADVTLIFRAVQPRVYGHGGPVKEWQTTAEAVQPLIAKLRAKAEAQFGPNPVCTTGPHCGDCRGRLRCPAAIRAGLSLYEVAAQALPDDPTPEMLGLQTTLVKRAIEHLRDLETVLDEHVLALVRGGAAVPGWGHEATLGRATWACSPEDAIAMAAALGVDISKPGVMTPNQAKKAGLDPETVKLLTTRPSRGFKIVPTTEESVRRAFN